MSNENIQHAIAILTQWWIPKGNIELQCLWLTTVYAEEDMVNFFVDVDSIVCVFMASRRQCAAAVQAAKHPHLLLFCKRENRKEKWPGLKIGQLGQYCMIVIISLRVLKTNRAFKLTLSKNSKNTIAWQAEGYHTKVIAYCHNFWLNRGRIGECKYLDRSRLCTTLQVVLLTYLSCTLFTDPTYRCKYTISHEITHPLTHSSFRFCHITDIKLKLKVSVPSFILGGCCCFSDQNWCFLLVAWFLPLVLETTLFKCVLPCITSLSYHSFEKCFVINPETSDFTQPTIKVTRLTYDSSAPSHLTGITPHLVYILNLTNSNLISQ